MRSGIPLFSLSPVVGTSSPNSHTRDVIFQLARGEFPTVTLKCCALAELVHSRREGLPRGSLLKANLLFKINLVALWGQKGFWSVGFLVFSCCSWWPVSTGVPSKRTLNILLVLHPRSTFSEELKPLQMYFEIIHMLPWLVSHWKIRIDVWGSAHGLDIS